MSAVRKWNQLLRALVVAIGILVLGVGAFRVGVIENQHVALWPTSGLLNPDALQEGQPFSTLAVFAAVHVTIWTSLVYLLFLGLDVFRRRSSGPS